MPFVEISGRLSSSVGTDAIYCDLIRQKTSIGSLGHTKIPNDTLVSVFIHGNVSDTNTELATNLF